jgi:hypothetical protein
MNKRETQEEGENRARTERENREREREGRERIREREKRLLHLAVLRALSCFRMFGLFVWIWVGIKFETKSNQIFNSTNERHPFPRQKLCVWPPHCSFLSLSLFLSLFLSLSLSIFLSFSSSLSFFLSLILSLSPVYLVFSHFSPLHLVLLRSLCFPTMHKNKIIIEILLNCF